MEDGEIPYDTLVLATGSHQNYFGHDAWAKDAPGLKTAEQAMRLRQQILSAFEYAERETDFKKRQAWLTFVVVGGGPTGVELAGAIAELARDILKREFRSINPGEAQIILLEGMARVLPTYPSDLSLKAETALKKLGVQVRSNSLASNVSGDWVALRQGDEENFIGTKTIIWTAGIKASRLGIALAQTAQIALDPAGRIIVEPDLTIPRHPEIFVIGDLAHAGNFKGKPLPATIPVAMQEGEYVASVIRQRLADSLKKPSPFRYRHRGDMATIGRAAAVVDLGRIRFNGFLAWLTWIFVHVVNLIEFENKLLVLMQWAWTYFTHNRSARLILKEFSWRDNAPASENANEERKGTVSLK